MPLPKLVLWFTDDDYEAIKGQAPNDSTLPNTFDEWLKKATEEIAELEAHSTPFVKVIVHSVGLAAYCEASNLDHNATTRGAYAVYVNRQGDFKNR